MSSWCRRMAAPRTNEQISFHGSCHHFGRLGEGLFTRRHVEGESMLLPAALVSVLANAAVTQPGEHAKQQ